jgi:hypothetical protein
MATDRYSDDHKIVVGGGSGTLTVEADLAVTGGISFSGDLAISGSVSATDITVSGSADSSIESTAGKIDILASLDVTISSSSSDINLSAYDDLNLYAGSGSSTGFIRLSPAGAPAPSYSSVYMTLSVADDEIVIGGPTLTIESDSVSISSDSVAVSSNAGNIDITSNGSENDINIVSDRLIYMHHSGNNSALILYDDHLEILAKNEGSGSLTENATSITNTWNSNNADVLYLRTFYSGTSGAGNNFIVFFDGNAGENDIGSIQGDGSGGVSLYSPGADYAEWMMINQESEWPEYLHLKENNILGIPEGTLVWISDSKIHRNAIGTPMIITKRAVVCGNSPKNSFYRASSEIGEKVSFIGQVPVIVEGPVKDGDYLLPKEGSNHCVAVDKAQITFEQYKSCIGTAWGSSDGSQISKVNCAIGIK